MIFYEDFIRKLSSVTVVSKKKYKFVLNFSKKLIWLSTGIPITLIGFFQFYVLRNTSGNAVGYILSILMILFGCYNIYMSNSYKVNIDTTTNKLFNKKFNIELDRVKLIELRKMRAPGSKKLEACLDIITHDKKQIIIPLIMNKKLEFVKVVQNIVKNKFVIIKD